MKQWNSWPYNDFYFMRRCVEIWKQNGVYASVTWQWPDALACPEYSTSVNLLEEIQHSQHVVELIQIGTIIICLSTIPLCIWCCQIRRRRLGKTSVISLREGGV